jgi:hypothetical protein
MADKAPKKRTATEGKVVSVRFTDAALHTKGRQFAIGQGITFGELVTAALAEYLRNHSGGQGRG